MTLQRNVALLRKLRESLMLDLALSFYPCAFVQPGTGERSVVRCVLYALYYL